MILVRAVGCVTAVPESFVLSGGNHGTLEGQDSDLLQTVLSLLPSGPPGSLAIYPVVIPLCTLERL